jgi:hypothetical protein
MAVNFQSAVLELRSNRIPKPKPISFGFVLFVLLTGCGSAGENAILGPDPGGGFYGPHDAFEGCINP